MNLLEKEILYKYLLKLAVKFLFHHFCIHLLENANKYILTTFLVDLIKKFQKYLNKNLPKTGYRLHSKFKWEAKLPG